MLNQLRQDRPSKMRVAKAAAFAIAAGAIVSLSASARANTIQPVLLSDSKITSGPNTGDYLYNYDLEFTPNNYLQSSSTYPSSITILDFGTVAGTPTLTKTTGNIGPDVTNTSDWAVSTNLTGASPLPDTANAAGNFLLLGSNGASAGAPDSGTLSNITLEYVGAGLPTSSSQRSLIQLSIISSVTPGSGPFNSLSLDGNPFTNVQQPDTYSVVTTPVPEPASLGALALGGLALLHRRKK
jgi:hypothetical protein